MINQVGNPWLRGTAAHGTRAIHRRMNANGKPLSPYANEFGAKKTPGMPARRFSHSHQMTMGAIPLGVTLSRRLHNGHFAQVVYVWPQISPWTAAGCAPINPN
ncbi:MAG: hypothetical protein VW339_02120 [Quisquiliibacterium sp.]